MIYECENTFKLPVSYGSNGDDVEEVDLKVFFKVTDWGSPAILHGDNAMPADAPEIEVVKIVADLGDGVTADAFDKKVLSEIEKLIFSDRAVFGRLIDAARDQNQHPDAP